MKRTGRKNQIFIGMTVLFLTLGFTTSALAVSTYNAITSTTLTLTGINGSNIDALNQNLFTEAFIWTDVIFPAAPTANAQASTLFNSSTPVDFSVGQFLFLEASVSGSAELGFDADSLLETQGEWAWTNNSAESFVLDFTLDWAMTANTFSENPLSHLAVAETLIFADYIDSNGGGTLLDNVFGRSVNGDGNYTNAGSSLDFTVFIGPNSSGDILISFNDAFGGISTGGAESPPPPVNPVPIPGSVLLLGAGLMGLVGIRRVRTN